MSVNEIIMPKAIFNITMDTFAEKKGKDYVEAMSVGYEYFSKIRKKWMS